MKKLKRAFTYKCVLSFLYDLDKEYNIYYNDEDAYFVLQHEYGTDIHSIIDRTKDTIKSLRYEKAE